MRSGAGGGAVVTFMWSSLLRFPSAFAFARSVWTMGRVRIEPNAASIVPGYAELDLQFRDPEDGPLDAFEQVVALFNPKEAMTASLPVWLITHIQNDRLVDEVTPNPSVNRK